MQDCGREALPAGAGLARVEIMKQFLRRYRVEIAGSLGGLLLGLAVAVPSYLFLGALPPANLAGQRASAEEQLLHVQGQELEEYKEHLDAKQLDLEHRVEQLEEAALHPRPAQDGPVSHRRSRKVRR